MPGVPSSRSWRRSSSSTAPSAMTEAIEYSRCGSGCRVASNAGRSPAGTSEGRRARCGERAADRSRRCRRPATAQRRQRVAAGAASTPDHRGCPGSCARAAAASTADTRPGSSRAVHWRRHRAAPAAAANGAARPDRRCRLRSHRTADAHHAGAATGPVGGRIHRSGHSCDRPARARRSAGAASAVAWSLPRAGTATHGRAGRPHRWCWR
ncbi:hypothetical protein G6F50_014607 [Rhizopus delemar]|uniref:Uncharacterized protein n=1 Tax=Rhizopus delemar TaxID=936053 RepID=A0A9P6Y3Y9_9FUNG|nr:hypothetical protein G6F50_014607 [Rhizopus delemar]